MFDHCLLCSIHECTIPNMLKIKYQNSPFSFHILFPTKNPEGTKRTKNTETSKKVLRDLFSINRRGNGVLIATELTVASRLTLRLYDRIIEFKFLKAVLKSCNVEKRFFYMLYM